jgi:hypothetical protein
MKVKTQVKAGQGTNIGVVGIGNVIGQNSGTANGVGVVVVLD